MSELGHSPWIKPGAPEVSGLIAQLTSFEGPMYEVFDEKDLHTWREWIDWLGREGDTGSQKHFVSKGEAMLTAVTELRERAMAAHGHKRYQLEPTGGGGKRSLKDLFSEPNLKIFRTYSRRSDRSFPDGC